MKKPVLSVLLILSITGYTDMPRHETPIERQSISPACALALAAALEDLRGWYSQRSAEEPISFESYVRQQYKIVICSEIEGRRISVAFDQPNTRGGGIWYDIEADSFEIRERVFGR